MHSTICCAVLALPMIGWNAVNFLGFYNESRITDFVTGAKIQPYLTHELISARDDRIKDCLRSGNCKN